ncbi:MAG: cyclic nucleotide-binding domain-containing protein, partial [Gammaproteobacteria bacterium]|nr:cyclic nucleotide-binding domain-containing protein [Gammaproteobacteria bacterium]
MPNDNTVQMLKKLVPLNLLSEEDLEQLLQSASFNRDKSGTYLFRQGDTDYHNVYLLSGQVALLDKMREVDRVTAGSETARFPLAHQIPRKNSVRAVGRVEYVLIDNRKLSELLVRSSDDDYKVTDLNASVTDDWMTQLLQSNVFQQIPAANIQGVIMRMEEVEVKRGQSVVKQGGEGDYFYLIHQGQCVVQRKEEGAEKPTELAKLGPGDSFGEEALLSDSPRNSSVRMLTEGILLRLAKEDFIEFVKRPLARGVGYNEALSLVKDGAVWLDVRLPDEYETGHIGKSVSLPLSTLRYQAPNLAVDQHYVICCGDGQLSATAAFLLTDRGYNVSVLEGGLRSAPEEILIQGEGKEAETSAKVISLHSGEELAEDTAPANGSEELENLRGMLAEANNKIKLLGVRFQGFKDKQQKEAAQRQAELKAQKVILDSTRSRLEELRGKRNAEKKSLEQSVQERHSLNTTLEEALEELGKANSSASDLGARLQEQQDSNHELLKEREELQGALDRLQKEQKQQQVESKKQKELTSTQRQDADERITQLEQQHQTVLVELEEELALSRNSLEEIVATRTELEKTIEDLRQEQTGIEHQHDVAVSEVEQQLEKLHQELAASEDKNHSALTELEQLNNRVNESESDLETSRQVRLESETKLQELQQAHEQSESELRDLRYTHQQSEVELTEVQDIHQQVEAELKQSHSDRRQIESDLEELKANSRRQAGIEQQHDAAVSEVEQQLEKLRQELAASEDKHHSTLAELEQLNNRVNESESDSETSRQVRLESETKLQELQQAHEQSESELRDLRYTHQQSEVELTELQDI